MGQRTALGRSVVTAGLMSILVACSIIISIAMGHPQQSGNPFYGHYNPRTPILSPHAHWQRQPGSQPNSQPGQIPPSVATPTPATTTTATTSTATSTDSPVTKQPFHVLAEDLKDDYFPWKDSSEEESVPGVSGNNNEDGMAGLHEDEQKHTMTCPELTSLPTPMATQLQAEEEEENAIQLKKALEKVCSIFRKYIESEAKQQARTNNVNIDESCSLVYRNSDPHRPRLFYNNDFRRYEDAAVYRLEGKAEGRTTGLPRDLNSSTVQFRTKQTNETVLIASFREKWGEFQNRTACLLDRTKSSCSDAFRSYR